jgi:hypothetical protein
VCVWQNAAPLAIGLWVAAGIFAEGPLTNPLSS